MGLCLYIWKKVYSWPDEQALLQFEGLLRPIKNIKCEQKMLISHRHIICRVQNICNAESIVLILTVKVVHNMYITCSFSTKQHLKLKSENLNKSENF